MALDAAAFCSCVQQYYSLTNPNTVYESIHSNGERSPPYPRDKSFSFFQNPSHSATKIPIKKKYRSNTQQKYSKPSFTMGNKNSIKRPFTCEICIEPMLSDKKKFRNNNLCVHPFCNKCVAKYVQFKIEDDRVAGIKCPGSNCDKLLDPLCCRALIPPQAFDRWCDLLCEGALLGLDRCYCPNRDCSAVVVNECGGIVKKSMCPNCKEWFCFKCRVTWHAEYQCEELIDWSDVAFADCVAKNKWMRCPRCRHCVERVYGCSIIKCRCGSSFCYKCGEKVYAHRCNCKDKANDEDTTNNEGTAARCTCTGCFLYFFQKFI